MSDPKSVRISVDGAIIEVEEGMQLAAALMGVGVVSLRKSVGGEPRGALCAMGVCHECRITVDGHRGVRSCLVPVRDGMSIETEQDLTPSPLPAVGAVQQRQEEVSVAIIGGGPAGIAAACAASELGADVLVIDESPQPGGRIWAHRRHIPDAARSWLARAEKGGVRWLSGYSVVDGKAGELLATSVLTGDTVSVKCQQIIVATGARERFLPFPGWTLPGVVGAGALQSLIKGGLQVRGKRLVVAGTGPLLLAVAQLAVEEGAKPLLVEQASHIDRLQLLLPLISSRSRMKQAMQLWKSLRGVEKLSSCWPIKVEGDGRVERVHLRTDKGVRVEEVDGLAVGFGLIPETRVAQGLGCRIGENGAVIVDRLQRSGIDGILCAGEPTGIAGSDAALDSGLVAGIVATGRTPRAHLLARVRRHRDWGEALEAAHQLRPQLQQLVTDDVVVCRCEDVTSKQLAGTASIREARMLCRVGMGPCQGRICIPAVSPRRNDGTDSVRPPWVTSPGRSGDSL